MVAVCEEAEGSWMDGVCGGGGKRKIGEKGRECSDVERLSVRISLCTRSAVRGSGAAVPLVVAQFDSG